MPQAAMDVCSGPGCRTAIPHGTRWCAACRTEHHRADRARRGDSRDTYNWRWRRYRAAFLKANPLCAECQRHGRVTPARVVDHVIDHKGDERLFWDTKNHQPLCDYTSPWDCHGRKVNAGDFGRRRP